MSLIFHHRVVRSCLCFQEDANDLNSRLFKEIESLSEAKAKLFDENKRSQIALSASSKSVVQTLLEKEQADVVAEARLQSKITENLRLVSRIQSLQSDLKCAKERGEQLEQKVQALSDENEAGKYKQQQVSLSCLFFCLFAAITVI